MRRARPKRTGLFRLALAGSELLDVVLDQKGFDHLARGVRKCETISGVTRCVYIQWPAHFYAYARHSLRRSAWHGSMVEDKKDAAGTHYRRNRHYDPATGRFTQEDPIGLAGGINLYGFANGDPVNFSDPYGLSAMCPTCLRLLAGAGGAALVDSPLPGPGDIVAAGLVLAAGVAYANYLFNEEAGEGSTGGPTAGRPATPGESSTVALSCRWCEPE